MCGDPMGGEHEVGEMEVVVFCLSSISPPRDCHSFLDGVESLCFCGDGECVSLIREVNRLHDLLKEMTVSLKRNVLEMKRKVNDVAITRTVKTKEEEEESMISIKEIIDPYPYVRSVTCTLFSFLCSLMNE